MLKFSDAEKEAILRQHDDGLSVAEICRSAGISQGTYFYWKKKFASRLSDRKPSLKALEEENSRLKRIVADLVLDREMLHDTSRSRS